MVLLQKHSLAGHGLVLDARGKGEYGGTGSRLDWDLASELSTSFNLNLAGGLDPDNVMEALLKVKPFGVDSSTGVEIVDSLTNERAKDPSKMRLFIEAVREADQLRSRRGIFRWFRRGGP
jgi:phosphoribosylanthranilate isomerase